MAGDRISALLEGLTDAQQSAVTSPARPLAVLAGAGSGKTRVLTRRIAYRAAAGTADPAHVLALTFTRKAAGELRDRLRRLGLATPVAAGTFHAVAFAQLRQISADRGQRCPAVLDNKIRFLAPLVTALVGPVPAAVTAAVAAEIEWAKARLVEPADYADGANAARRPSPLPADEMTAVFLAYEADKRRRGVLDFDDLLLRTAEAIELDKAVAAAQRWRWQHLFVDEYQDLNPAHARLLSAWMGRSMDLCVVGDPHQAIYEWNGADPSLLTSFTERFPTAKVIALRDNFRSSPEIQTVAGAALGLPGPLPGPPSVAATGPVPIVRAYGTDDEEARGIARALRDLHAPGTHWSRLAVLARTNAQLAIINEALATAGIPSRVQGGRSFAPRPALAALLAGHGGRPARALVGEIQCELGTTRPCDPVEGARSDPDVPAPIVTVTNGGAAAPIDVGTVDDRQAALIDGRRALLEYLDLDPSGTVAGFESWLRAAHRSAQEGRGDAVVLSTFHRAKGLEWPVVFVAGLEDGLVPLVRAGGRPPPAEERRLLYVALTRAERELHCSWARQRRFGDQMVRRTPSPFLPGLLDAITALAEIRLPADPRPTLRLVRQRLADGSGSEGAADGRSDRAALSGRPDGLLDELRRWRAAVAHASRVPPGAVIADPVLAAMAKHRPSSRAGLVALAGLGPTSADRWCDELLAVLGRHASA